MKYTPVLVLSMLALTACSGTVSQDDYNAKIQEVSQLSAELESMSSDLSAAKSELDKLNTVSKEYALYKESMQEYEGLASQEAEARKIQASSIAAAESQSREESKAAELAAKEAEEKAGYETGITYEQLARTPDEYEGKKIKFSGTVVQVIEGSNEIEIRLATKSSYDNILYCSYRPDIVSSRVLEDDKITVYGTSIGTISYQSTMGGQITIPAAIIDKIDQ